MHSPGRATRGLQSFPLVADGVLYYTGSYSRVFALDAATGQVIWSYVPKLDEDLSRTQTHTPYTRGIALGHGHVYVGTVDGRLIALDMKTGKQVWDTKLINSEKLTVGFTGAPLVVKDKVIIGAQGGEWPWPRPDLRRRRRHRREEVGVLHRRRHARGAEDLGQRLLAHRRRRRLDARRLQCREELVYWGTANPAPLFDWAGADWKTEGAAAGRQPLHQLGDRARPRHRPAQELLPDPAARRLGLRRRGRRVRPDREGRQEVRRPPEQGRLRLRLRRQAEFKNAWPLAENINFIQGVDKSGKLIGRRDLHGGQDTRPVPGHLRRHQLELRHLQPEDRPLLQGRHRSGAWTSRS